MNELAQRRDWSKSRTLRVTLTVLAAFLAYVFALDGFIKPAIFYAFWAGFYFARLVGDEDADADEA